MQSCLWLRGPERKILDTYYPRILRKKSSNELDNVEKYYHIMTCMGTIHPLPRPKIK